MQNQSSKCVKAYKQINVYVAFLAFVVHHFFRKNLLFMTEHFATQLKDHRIPLVGRGPSFEKRCSIASHLTVKAAFLF